MFTLAACALVVAAQSGLDHSKASLISSVKSFKPGSSFFVGINFKMTPGWHIYWRNPGDSGMEVRVNWLLPKGWKAGPMQWPAPEAIVDGDIVNYGYSKEATLLTVLYAPPEAKATTIKADLTWLTCDDEMCLPVKQTVTLPLKSAQTAVGNPPGNLKIIYVATRLPKTQPIQGTAELVGTEIKVKFALKEESGQIAFYPYDAATVGTGKYVASVNGGELSYTLKKSEFFDKKAARLRGILVGTSLGSGKKPNFINEINIPLKKESGGKQ